MSPGDKGGSWWQQEQAKARISKCLELWAFQQGGTGGDGPWHGSGRRAEEQAAATPAWAGRQLMATARGAESWGGHSPHPLLGGALLGASLLPLSISCRPRAPPALELCSPQCQPERSRSAGAPLQAGLEGHNKVLVRPRALSSLVQLWPGGNRDLSSASGARTLKAVQDGFLPSTHPTP